MRWSKLDKKLKQTLPKLNKVYRDIEDDVLEIVETYKEKDINEMASDRLKRKIENIVKESDSNSLFYVYAKSLLKHLSIANAIEILIYWTYTKVEETLDHISNLVFEFCREDALDELKKDTDKEYKISDSKLNTFIIVLNKPYRNYLTYLSSIDYNETYRKVITTIQSGEINVAEYDKLIEKQRNRVLNINEEKRSGVLHDTAIRVENECYVEPLRKENNKVVFWNPMDERTSTMCSSLYGKVFNTNDWNEFDRFADGSWQHFKVFGLEVGINLPPIDMPTHHCRSEVIEYNAFIKENPNFTERNSTL